MAFSKIVVTFNDVPQLDTLSIRNSLSSTDLFETFKLERFQNFQTTIGIDTIESAFNYKTALELDYNTGGLYTIEQASNTVTITATQDGVVFTEITNTSSGRITTSITNESPAPTFTIDSVVFSQSDTDACGKVKATVTTSELATKITSPVSVDPNANNPFELDVLRASTVTISCETATLSATEDVLTPAKLSVAETSVNVVNTPTGGNITITHNSTYLLNLEYSLNDVDWQTSNAFTGLTEGNYTIYVRDQFGCKISTSFAISIFTPDISVTTPFVHVGKELSIRYKKDEVWDNCNIYRTEENTLSCEEYVEHAYPYYHKFQTCDMIVTQFLSNYESLSANVIKEDGTKDAMMIVQRSQNLGATDKRDARYYKIETGKTGVYYTTGKIYDYTTGNWDGETTYELYGDLPNYGAIGNYIYLDSIGWYEIIDIIYDDDKDADVLVIEYTYEGAEDDIIVSSLYNRKNYEVYEFSTDMSNYDGEEIQIEILMLDSSFENRNFKSEKILVQEVWNDTLELKWFNPTDTFIYYSTGLINKARVDFQSFLASTDSELDIHKTDTTTILISSESYETMTLESDYVTTGIKRQLDLAFIHKELYINGVKYVLNSSPESEPIKFTNQHILTYNLTKTGNVFNSEYNASGDNA